jgi:hypothetical protein
MRVIRVSFRAFRLQVPAEREELYDRIKKLLKKAEDLANTHKNVRMRLRAMEVAVRLSQFLEGVLKDVQLDEIEDQLEELEKTQK